jgi:shikimate dehydrogenase
MTPRPDRLVLLGHPVAHSLSPVFQNAALAAAGIPVRYEAIDVPPQFMHTTLDDAKHERWAGNVTVPHKETVFARCRELTPVARRVGAVNTFRASPEGIVGHNTDVHGVSVAVRDLLGADPVNLEIGIIGAGGSAAAVLAAVETWKGCRAIVANRGKERLRALVERFSSVAREGDTTEISSHADVVVNATSLGMRDADDLPIAIGPLARRTAVLDLVYSPNETRLVRAARARGLRAADGLRMLVGQGAAAFEWWFDVAPDTEVMWRSLRAIRSAGS